MSEISDLAHKKKNPPFDRVHNLYRSVFTVHILDKSQ